jgi:polyvinyl alcohol dehydrogenase (cytochrome)
MENWGDSFPPTRIELTTSFLSWECGASTMTLRIRHDQTAWGNCKVTTGRRDFNLSFRCLFLLAVVGLGGCTQKTAPPIDGAALFKTQCAGCHSNDNGMRAPEPAALKEMSRRFILTALETGKMSWEGKKLKKPERAAIAEYLGKSDAAISAGVSGLCTGQHDARPSAPAWAGWGQNPQNTRFLPTSAAGLDHDQVRRLQLKWAFGFAGAAATYGQPTIDAGKLYVGSEDGTVYALDAETGCMWWRFRAADTVKTAVSISKDGHTAFFGDTSGYVYAVDARNGARIWRAHPEPHPAARITGSPLLAGNRLYVPVSSGEEGASADPAYGCCTFRGSVVALDSATGKQIWQTYVIEEPAKPTRKGPRGVQYFGPAGGAVWSPPTADLKRRVLYVATGNDYSYPGSDSSDSILAIDMSTGKKLWHRQFTPKDQWNSGCVAPQKDNCPEHSGPDYDFGAPPILTHLTDGRDILLMAQKSGMVYALDARHRGRVLWETQLGHGGPLGGIEWGGTVDGRYAYYPLSDYDFDKPLMSGGGLFALDLRTGKKMWFAPPQKPSCGGVPGCGTAQMAPPTAIPGVVFAGSLDGHLRAYEASTGQVIWDFNTAQEFSTINGVKGHGGSLNGSGPMIAGGMVFVNSGYTNAMDGNVLLAFGVEGGNGEGEREEVRQPHPPEARAR